MSCSNFCHLQWNSVVHEADRASNAKAHSNAPVQFITLSMITIVYEEGHERACDTVCKQIDMTRMDE